MKRKQALSCRNLQGDDKKQEIFESKHFNIFVNGP